MKGMERILWICSLLLTGTGQAQEIKFDQGNWQSKDLAYQRILATLVANEERVDSVYTENLETSELQLVIQKYPLARYEYYPGTDPFPPLRRRIDIRQEVTSDSSRVELSNGTFFYYPWTKVIDIPNGAYQEFYPNGMIRITGTLDGYDPDGSLKKKGTWIEWDAEGNVIREEHYP